MKRKAMAQVLGVAVALIAALIAAAAGPAGAATLYVANSGTDSLTCGASGDPCRSISQAIANAQAKDRIVVGPGRYGDLNGNGILGEPGEETGGPCNCMVYVGKQLTLESEEGAGATILDANGTAGVIGVVGSGASGSVIGKPGKGFTLTRGNLFGLGVGASDHFPSELTISGNIAVDNDENGFSTGADVGTYKVTGNFAIRNGTNGFIVEPPGGSHTFRDNVAIANGFSGFNVRGVGSGHSFINNLAMGNGRGFEASIQATGLTYRGNSAIGNKGQGWAFFDAATGTLTHNNIYGNDPTSNCGLFVGGGTTVSAAHNFFGAATGPGADPADEVCNGGGSVVFTPFATKEFGLSTTWK